MERSDELLRAASGEARKTAITSGTTLASYGKLNAEQDDQWREYIFDRTKLLRNITTITMNGPTRELDFFDISSEIMRAATENTEQAGTSITTSTRTLSSTEVIIVFKPTYSFIEDNIAKENGLEKIVGKFGTGFANDLSNLGLNGDGVTGDFRSIEKGFLQLIKDDIGNSHHYDTEGSTDYKGTVLPNTWAQLPDKFAENEDALQFMVSRSTRDAIQEDLGSRSTAMGDKFLVEGKDPHFKGIPVVAYPYFPDGEILLTNPKNLVIGIQRGTTFESEKKILQRRYNFVITSRIDFQIHTLDGLVYAYNS